MKTPFNRRDFLRQSGMAALCLSVLPSFSFKTKEGFLDEIGLQLYTVRDVLASDPMGTLEAIQKAGYQQVEMMDTGLLGKLGPVLKSMNLPVYSSHFSSPYITGNWEPMTAFGASVPEKKDFETVVELAAKHQLRFLVFPFLFPQDRGGLDAYKQLSEKLNRAGETCKSAGIELCYHNHSFEFQPMEKSSPFQVLTEELDPSLVNFELDVFWVSVAGMDPASFIRGHQDRIRMLHLKDKKRDTPQTYKAVSMPEDSFQPLGSGVLDFQGILDAALDAQVVYGFVEQDMASDPLASMKKSIQYLKKLQKE